MNSKNAEGYPDPTAAIALANITKEERRARKNARGKKHGNTRYGMVAAYGAPAALMPGPNAESILLLTMKKEVSSDEY